MSSSELFPGDEDEWVLAQGKNANGPIMLRYRGLQPSGADMESFRHLILARWPYSPRDASGLPDDATMSAMEEFEERFFEASDAAASWGTCVAVMTHNGAREWRFYAPDVETFQHEFSWAHDGVGPYPFEFEVFEDPEWSGLAEFRDNAD